MVKNSGRGLTYNGKARKRWRGAEWISGSGRWATLAHCNVLTVQLHETEEKAIKAKQLIDGGGCGGFCYKDHSMVDMELQSRKEREAAERAGKLSRRNHPESVKNPLQVMTMAEMMGKEGKS